MDKVKIKQNRNLLIVGIICLVALVGIVGYTYSFFQVKDTDTGSIVGTVASTSLEIEVEKLVPSTNVGLIPQLDEYITNAVVGKNNKNCVDDNGNEVCQVYSITVTNTSSVTVNVDGLVELNAGNNQNLKWAEITGYTLNMTTNPTLASDYNLHTFKNLTTNEEYAPSEEKTYYIVVWISEINEEQNDTGTFTGTVTFKLHEETQNSVSTSAPETLAYLRELGFNGTLSEGVPSTLQTGATTDEGLFAAEDDQGTSYYFRGAVENNYVKFGKYTEDAYQLYPTMSTTSYANSCGDVTECVEIASAGEEMYWRIVRINGDGTIRLIYDGTSPHINGTTSEKINIGYSYFHEKDNGYNISVGYMYGQKDASTYEATHANINDSAIKTTIDRWYSKYLNINYGSSIANAIYCNDRSLDTSNASYTGIGSTTTYYGAYQRLGGNKSPILTCEQVNDRFTLQGEIITTTDGLGGNQDLIYPIGLITADEVMFAGGTNSMNDSYYLYFGYGFYTGTPEMTYSKMVNQGFHVNNDGMLTTNQLWVSTASSNYTRPVISLKPETIKFGDGTSGNPFRMEQ